MNEIENQAYKYFDSFFSPETVEKIRILNSIDYTKEPKEEEIDLFLSLPKFNLFSKIFANEIFGWGNAITLEKISKTNEFQFWATSMLPNTVEKYWQTIRRKEGFTGVLRSTGSFTLQSLLKMNDFFRGKEYQQLDDFLKEEISRELTESLLAREVIGGDPRLVKYVIQGRAKRLGRTVPLDQPTEYEIVKKTEHKRTGLTIRTFKTPFGETGSFWDLNSEQPPYLEFNKDLLI